MFSFKLKNNVKNNNVKINVKNNNVKKSNVKINNVKKNNVKKIIKLPTLCMIAIFKNESHILKQWIDHYIIEGVNKFFMIDNGSNDNYKPILNPYILNKKVELVIDTTKHSQNNLYNKYFLNKCKLYDWVMVCDLDEFIYARRDCKKITNYLSKLNDSISQVFVPWKIFGSNGKNTMNEEQPKNVIESFTKRINYNKEKDFQGVIIENNIKYSFTKCIVKTKHLINLNIHSHKTKNNNYITSDNKKNNIHKNNSFAKINENILNESYLQLNHYAIQSFSWFMKVKTTRGDATINNNVRNENYYREFDKCSNDINDNELFNKLNKT